MSKSLKDAEEYIENNMKADNGNMGLIAWKFLVGCRILECLEKIMGAPNQGANIEVQRTDLDNCEVRLGHYKIYMAYEPVGQVNPLNEPNSE